MATKGRIILLNRTSSSGKTTFAQALRSALDPQFHYYASDRLADEGFDRWLSRPNYFGERHFSTAFTGPLPALRTLALTTEDTRVLPV